MQVRVRVKGAGVIAAAALWAATGAALPAAAQDGASGADEAKGTSIVVTGVDLRPGEELPVKAKERQRMTKATRQIVSDAGRFARCSGLPRKELLARIVDGRPETGEAMNALHLHVLRNSGCSSQIPPRPPLPQSPYYGDCNPMLLPDGMEICRSDYDRGEVYEGVLRKYAADLRLTRVQTFDPAIRAAFTAREEARNVARNRSGKLFWLAACLVQVRPEYGQALLDARPGSDRERRLVALMISDGAKCLRLDDVSDVRVDIGQLRAFVAEAVYAWAVAANGGRSLLPPAA